MTQVNITVQANQERFLWKRETKVRLHWKHEQLKHDDCDGAAKEKEREGMEFDSVIDSSRTHHST